MVRPRGLLAPGNPCAAVRRLVGCDAPRRDGDVMGHLRHRLCGLPRPLESAAAGRPRARSCAGALAILLRSGFQRAHRQSYLAVRRGGPRKTAGIRPRSADEPLGGVRPARGRCDGDAAGRGVAVPASHGGAADQSLVAAEACFGRTDHRCRPPAPLGAGDRLGRPVAEGHGASRLAAARAAAVPAAQPRRAGGLRRASPARRRDQGAAEETWSPGRPDRRRGRGLLPGRSGRR